MYTRQLASILSPMVESKDQVPVIVELGKFQYDIDKVFSRVEKPLHGVTKEKTVIVISLQDEVK